MDIIGIDCRMLFASNVELLDVSPDGISFRADTRLNIGREYTLKIIAQEKVLNLKGTVVWSKLTENLKDFCGNVIPIYTAGMKFIDIPTKKKIYECVDLVKDRNT